MTDVHIWWYVTRATGIVAWGLLTFSAVWGVLLAAGVLRRVAEAGRLRAIHRFLSSLALILVVIHMVSLAQDEWAHFRLDELLVPLASAYRPMPVALGIVALYLLLAAYGSSLIKDRLPAGLWRGIHVGNYVAVVLVSFHAGLAGTDAGRWWYLSIAVTLIALTGAAVLLRVALLGGNERSRIVRPEAPVFDPTLTPGGAGARETIQLVVLDASPAADGVRRLVLSKLGGGVLPPWEPGAHLTLVLPDGATRQYSLCGDPADRDRYEIAVLRVENSRGGSQWIHDNVTPGSIVETWLPENHFPLVAAKRYLFVAGGIGITPIRAMIDSLPATRDWTLLYLGRSRTTMAFLPELLTRFPDRVVVHASDEHDGRFDVTAAIAGFSGEVYSCGPAELVDAVLAAGADDHVRVERFVAVDRPGLPQSSFTVECRRSGREVEVPTGVSMLQALEDAGVPVVASCRKGVCGSCETVVVGGAPEHLDSVIPDDEKDELAIMYPCVSRSIGPRLVVEL